jgi:hypothetical protein
MKHCFVSLFDIKSVAFNLLKIDLDLLQLEPLVESSSQSPHIKRIKELETEKTKYKFHIVSTLVLFFLERLSLSFKMCYFLFQSLLSQLEVLMRTFQEKEQSLTLALNEVCLILSPNPHSEKIKSLTHITSHLHHLKNGFL